MGHFNFKVGCTANDDIESELWRRYNEVNDLAVENNYNNLS